VVVVDLVIIMQVEEAVRLKVFLMLVVDMVHIIPILESQEEMGLPIVVVEEVVVDHLQHQVEQAVLVLS
tara:strand:+ start:453 stop:659 length:207 start_codon:yes stop_codon:yes gene_type:complete